MSGWRFIVGGALVFSFSFLGGCAGNLGEANLRKIHMDMTQAEVEAILGPGEVSDKPDYIPAALPKGTTIKSEIWDDGNTRLRVYYSDDKVKGISTRGDR